MSIEENFVNCCTHGLQQETFVCQHIVQGLHNRQRVGFFWSTYSPENPRPDAWCAECEQRVAATGGEWIGEAEANLGAKILCGVCYDMAKILHSGGDPWS